MFAQVHELAEQVKETWKAVWQERTPPSCVRACPSPRVVWDGTRIRSVTVHVEGQTVYVPEVPCRRLFCRGCDAKWTRRPEGTVARRHYQPCVVASSLAALTSEPAATPSSVARDAHCSPRTVGRWVKWTSEIAEPAIVAKDLLQVTETPILPPPVLVPAAEKKARSSKARARLLLAAQILVLLEALASARGLPPPGLGSVPRQTLPDGVTTYAAPRIAALCSPVPIPADAAGKPRGDDVSSGCERRRTASR